MKLFTSTEPIDGENSRVNDKSSTFYAKQKKKLSRKTMRAF